MANQTLRSAFLAVQQSESTNGSQNAKNDEERRRKAYLQKQADFEENRKKVLKLAENKRMQAERRAKYEAQERMEEEKRRAEEIKRALEMEQQRNRPPLGHHVHQHSGEFHHARSRSQPEKPTPAPRGRPSLPSGQFYKKKDFCVTVF